MDEEVKGEEGFNDAQSDDEEDAEGWDDYDEEETPQEAAMRLQREVENDRAIQENQTLIK